MGVTSRKLLLTLCTAIFVSTMGCMFGRTFLAAHSLSLIPPHQARTNPPLTPLKQAQLRRWSSARQVNDAEDAIALALEFTSESFWFGLNHATTHQHTVAAREANCVEYAHLFAQSVEFLSKLHGLKLDATPVRSRARVLGQSLPWRGWRRHDWVLVRQHDAGVSYYVDAAFYDYGLGWDVSVSVHDKDTLP